MKNVEFHVGFQLHFWLVVQFSPDCSPNRTPTLATLLCSMCSMNCLCGDHAAEHPHHGWTRAPTSSAATACSCLCKLGSTRAHHSLLHSSWRSLSPPSLCASARARTPPWPLGRAPCLRVALLLQPSFVRANHPDVSAAPHCTSHTIPPSPAVAAAARRGARGQATEGHRGLSCVVPWVRAGSPLPLCHRRPFFRCRRAPSRRPRRLLCSAP
jgi:hypothetical protein